MALARVVEVHTSSLSFVKMVDRSSTLLVVPVPSSRGSGRALLLFVARSRGRKSRWWSPTIALSGRPLVSLMEALRGTERGRGGVAFKSKSGFFIALRRRGAEGLLLIGQGGVPFASFRLRKSDAAKLAEMLERALSWPPAELPTPLSWKVKEALFGRYVS
ncbi:MAG: hypothetical protein QXG48_03025 [Thermofilaceae archaeon]